MAKYIIAAFCMVLMMPALADDTPSAVEMVRQLAEEQDKAEQEQAAKEARQKAASEQAAKEPKQQPADDQPAKPEEAAGKDAAAAQAAPASGVPAAAPQAPEGQPEQPAMVSKSSVPADKRKGGDITQCLDAGGQDAAGKKDKEVAACAEPYSPRKQRTPARRH